MAAHWHPFVEHQPKTIGTRSWWLDCKTREEFDAAAARERLRMALSQEARLLHPPTLGGVFKGSVKG